MNDMSDLGNGGEGDPTAAGSSAVGASSAGARFAGGLPRQGTPTLLTISFRLPTLAERRSGAARPVPVGGREPTSADPTDATAPGAVSASDRRPEAGAGIAKSGMEEARDASFGWAPSSAAGELRAVSEPRAGGLQATCGEGPPEPALPADVGAARAVPRASGAVIWNRSKMSLAMPISSNSRLTLAIVVHS